MEERKDILEELRHGGNPYKVPQGYFEDLGKRLSAIPSEEPASSAEEESSYSVTIWDRLKPILAIAAAFLVMVSLGTAVLRSTASRPSVETDEIVAGYTYLTPYTDPDAIYSEDYNVSEGPTDEDIVEYLISTGISSEHIEYVAQNEKNY